MLSKKTELDQVEVRPDGTVQVRIVIRVFEDDKELSRSGHRTAIPAGIDPAAQMAAVNAHLRQMGHDVLGESDFSRIAQIAAVAHRAEFIGNKRAKEATLP